MAALIYRQLVTILQNNMKSSTHLYANIFESELTGLKNILKSENAFIIYAPFRPLPVSGTTVLTVATAASPVEVRQRLVRIDSTNVIGTHLAQA